MYPQSLGAQTEKSEMFVGDRDRVPVTLRHLSDRDENSLGI